MSDRAEVVICGAGIAGVSAAFHLAVRRGVRDVVLVDPHEPMSLTSRHATAAYRDWWPEPDDARVRLLSRSLDLLEELAHESGRAFRRCRRGYVYLTADPNRAAELLAEAEAVAGMGVGPLRRHPGPVPYVASPEEGFSGAPGGADWIEDPDEIRRVFPWVTDKARALLHVRRAGWLDSQAFGAWLLDCAEARGVRVIRDEVRAVVTEGGRVRSVRLASGGIDTERVVLATGPYLRQAGRWLDLDLPLTNYLRAWLALEDPEGIVPRDAPLLIWSDPVRLPWSEEERRELARDPDGDWVLGELPPGARMHPHDVGDGRSEAQLRVLWRWREKEADPLSPEWPPQAHPRSGEVLLRGLSRMIPGLERYFGHGKEALVEAGYDCRTPENRPLIGPLPVQGAYVLGALSGSGVMSSQAAAELLAAHVTGAPLPPWAGAFAPDRYEDPAYRARLDAWKGWTGEL